MRTAIYARTSTDGLSAAFATRLLDPQRRAAFERALGLVIANAVWREITASARSEPAPPCIAPPEKSTR